MDVAVCVAFLVIYIDTLMRIEISHVQQMETCRLPVRYRSDVTDAKTGFDKLAVAGDVVDTGYDIGRKTDIFAGIYQNFFQVAAHCNKGVLF